MSSLAKKISKSSQESGLKAHGTLFNPSLDVDDSEESQSESKQEDGNPSSNTSIDIQDHSSSNPISPEMHAAFEKISQEKQNILNNPRFHPDQQAQMGNQIVPQYNPQMGQNIVNKMMNQPSQQPNPAPQQPPQTFNAIDPQELQRQILQKKAMMGQ